LELFVCAHCGLQFFLPLVSGSADFYKFLSTVNSYYSPARWEFSQVLKRIDGRTSVVDVGCGDGRFLSLIPHGNKIGLEHNPSAVVRAVEKGLDVRSQKLNELDTHSASMVTFFQVLEHVVDPSAILTDAIRVLCPNGHLAISVPNNDAFMGEAIQEPLNVPPHHPLRWTKASLNSLTDLFSLRLESFEEEPLSKEQVFLYRKTLITRAVARCTGKKLPLMRLTPGLVLLRKAANALSLASLRFNPSLPTKRAAGHTMLAIYRKT
jgi:SAM-dependent methyltransferase